MGARRGGLWPSTDIPASRSRLRMPGLLRACACILAAIAPAVLHGQAAEPPTVLYPGDAVRISVWRQPDLSGEFWIAADSSIRHPLYQSVKVAGIPMDAARARVAAFLLRFQDSPQFVMEPLLRVAIGGEIAQPGLHTFRPEVTIAQAVILAGGLTQRARLDDVRILRGGQVYSADLTKPEQGLAAQSVRSGDQITILPRRRPVYSYIVPSVSFVSTMITLITVLRR